MNSHMKWIAVSCVALVARVAPAQSASDPRPQPQPVPAQPTPAQNTPDAPASIGVPDGTPFINSGVQLKPEDAQRLVQLQNAYVRLREATEKAAWIGVSVSPATDALRHQLKLPEGTGLLVDFVQPGSPADQAGVKQYDLLQKLDDQLLINADQFAVLVRTYKPGSSIQLTVLREGDRQLVPVKLAEHEVPRWESSRNALRPGDPLVGEAGERPDLAWRLADAGPERSYTWMDGQRQVTVRVMDGHHVLLVMEPQSGKILEKYVVDSAKDLDALPPRMREILDGINKFDRKGTSLPVPPQELGSKPPAGATPPPSPRP